jgi:flagellar biosynthesis GTPase FlhF
MQIKRFEAKDMTTALRLIKDELGPEAVILSARNIRKAQPILGLAKSVGVEVTAAVDAYQLPDVLNSASYAGGLNSYRRHTTINGSKKRTLRSSVGSRVKTLAHRKQTHQGGNRVGFENEAVCADVLQHLLSQEVNRAISGQPIRNHGRTHFKNIKHLKAKNNLGEGAVARENQFSGDRPHRSHRCR